MKFRDKIRVGSRVARRILRWMTWLVFTGCLFWVDMGHAQTSQKKEAPTEIPPVSEAGGPQPWGRPEWNRPEAFPEKFDWIQLTSGEWLKGELKALYEDSLEFDSDELDLLHLDWEDIKEVHGHRRYSVRLEGPVEATGMLRITDDKVFISNMGETREFARNRLITIAPVSTSGLETWSAKVALSLNVQKGNTDQLSYTTTAWAKRRTATSLFHFDYLGIYNQTNGIDTSQSQRVNSHHDLFMSRQYYWRTVFGEYFRDPFSNIEHRVTVGTGLGYHIIDTPRTKWDITPGLAYQYTRNKSVEAGQDPDQTTPSIVAEALFDTELTKTIDFLTSYKINIVNRASGTYSHHALVKIEIELTENLDLDLSAVWDRIQDPAPAADGRVPAQDDFYYFIGIGYEL